MQRRSRACSRRDRQARRLHTLVSWRPLNHFGLGFGLGLAALGPAIFRCFAAVVFAGFFLTPVVFGFDFGAVFLLPDEPPFGIRNSCVYLGRGLGSGLGFGGPVRGFGLGSGFGLGTGFGEGSGLGPGVGLGGVGL